MNKDVLLTTYYRFSSGIGELEAGRYVTCYELDIFTVEEDPSKNKLVGKGDFYLIHLGLGMNNKFSAYEIFDYLQPLLDLGEQIYDYASYDYKEELNELYGHEFISSDICYVNNLELLPEYRNCGLGKRIFKDIFSRFEGSCGLFAIQAYPSQHGDPIFGEDWESLMKFPDLESDEEKACYKLYSYFQSLGFENPFHNEYFFYNPARVNKKLNEILFD